MSSNLAQLLTQTASEHGDRPALKLDDAVVTYQMLDEGAARVAGLLQARGLQPGDRVGIMLPNVPYFGLAYYGVVRAGGVVVPMNVLLKAREVKFYLSDSGAKHLFAWHDFLTDAEPGAREAGTEVIAVRPGEFERLLAQTPRQAEDVPREESDTAVILYTSGTTGTPKGAELTHFNMLANCFHGGTELVDVSERDVVLGALPLFHSFGQTCCLNTAVRVGACLTMIPRFDPGKALEIIERDRVTLFDGVPTMYHALLNYENIPGIAAIAGRMRVAVSGGAALPAELMRRFEERFGVPILEGYGLSETSPVATFNRVDRPRRPGSVGLPVWGVQIKIVRDDGSAAEGEPGEVAIRGNNVMKGYFRRPEATAEVMDAQGWFRTGDVGIHDADGYLYIVDRKKDMIIRGGFNVYPRELEEVLLTHPGVSLVAVVGVPHRSHGEEVKAFVVRAPGATLTEAELIAWCKQNMAAYKYPRIVEFRDGLPMTATGKILKRELARAAGAGDPQPTGARA